MGGGGVEGLNIGFSPKSTLDNCHQMISNRSKTAPIESKAYTMYTVTTGT